MGLRQPFWESATSCGRLPTSRPRASWLAWLSPIGWAQQTRSYGENQWWPLLACLGAAVVLCGIALVLERRRDLGAGFIPERVGPSAASALLRTQTGLTLRLQRGSLIGWTLGIIVFALFFGGVATAMADLLSGDNPITDAFLGGSKNVLDGLLGFFMMANALLVAAFVLQSTDSIRAAESAGRTELQWSSAISRSAAATTWSLFAVAVVLSMFGDLFGLPEWIVKNTPFTAIPRLGMDFTVLPLAVITVLAVIAGGPGSGYCASAT